MNHPDLIASFIPRDAGALFALARRPRRADRCVLIVPPFGEEMNKSRRMFAELSTALAERGIGSVIVDLYGTGDSGGEFRDATFSQWRADLADAAAWSAAAGCPVTDLLAVRLGCVLVAAAIGDMGIRSRTTVFWQPVVDGKRFLTQFLRLRLAASLLGTEGKETVKDLRERLQRGDVLEVAGYEISGALAAAVEAATLPASPDPRLGTVHWLEVVREGGAVSSAADSYASSSAGVRGEPFWASTEIVTNSALLERTVAAIVS